VVRGRLTVCVAVAIAVFTADAALAQPPTRWRYRAAPPSEKFPLPTDTLIAAPAPVPARTAYQPGPVDEPNVQLPGGTQIPIPQGKPRRFSWTPRYGTRGTMQSEKLPDGTERSLFTGGVIFNATTDRGEEIELATDNAVLWRRGAVQNAPDGFHTEGDGKTEVEFYLSGNVIVRTKSDKSPLQVLRATEVYYDVERERAIALTASLEFTPRFAPDPFHVRGREIWRLDAENWEAHDASFDSSKLPSDPGLSIESGRVTYVERQVRLRNVFGIPYRELLTGQPVFGDERTVTAYGAVPKVMGVPVWYWPRVRTDANDPLGPFVGMGFGQNRMYGTQVYTTWDIFDLLALRPPPGHRWRLNADYLSKRGPALGTDYLYKLPGETPGLWGSEGMIKLYGMRDHGEDILGGNRGPEPVPPDFRGRAMWRHQQEILEGLYFQGQVAYLSDQNFLEEFYKNEFDAGPNQETFAYLSWNRGNLWASGLANVRLNRPWVPETQWIPRLDGALVGQSFFDMFVYDARANAGYALARRTDTNPASILATDQNINTGRIDLMQELSLPFSLGPVKFAPYGMLDLTGYTEDLTGSSAGRVWGGGGTRASLPFSRLYEGASSDLFNVRGLYHKAVLGANYLYARSSIPYTDLPMLDRLNDDATDQAWRNITPMQPQYVSGPNGLLLADAPDPLSPFNPQRYAIRRLVMNRVDTLDNMNVLQLDLRQRLQTKRGYPGLEHTVDLVSLLTSISYFPQASRDNFGHPFAFLEYDFLWNIGDRTAFSATGWFEPYDQGSSYFTFGSFFNRPDRTTFYLGYRQIDPVNSRAVLGSVGYQLSQRYFLNAGVSYDFGINQALSNSFTLTRTGTDLTVSIGFTYNSLVNNFGFQFLVVPNIVNSISGGRFAGTPLGTQALNRGQR
jgi:lipopolysaccharide transport LptD-like protein